MGKYGQGNCVRVVRMGDDRNLGATVIFKFIATLCCILTLSASGTDLCLARFVFLLHITNLLDAHLVTSPLTGLWKQYCT